MAELPIDTPERLRKAYLNQKTVMYLAELLEVSASMYEGLHCETPDYQCSEAETFSLCSACYAQHIADKFVEKLYGD